VFPDFRSKAEAKVGHAAGSSFEQVLRSLLNMHHHKSMRTQLQQEADQEL
jgi:hypothetical protein